MTIACLITGKWFVSKIKVEHRERLLQCILCGWNPLEEKAEQLASRLDEEITQQFVQRFIEHMKDVWHEAKDEREMFEGLLQALEEDMEYIPGMTEDGRLTDEDRIDEMWDRIDEHADRVREAEEKVRTHQNPEESDHETENEGGDQETNATKQENQSYRNKGPRPRPSPKESKETPSSDPGKTRDTSPMRWKSAQAHNPEHMTTRRGAQ